MSNKPTRSKEPAPKPDLTPMIDLVFNLIIFFMVVSELSNLTVEQLELAHASEAKEPRPESPQDKVLQVNVLRDGRIRVNGATYAGDPTKASAHPSLHSFVDAEAAGYPREEPSADSLAPPPSKLRTNVRADRDTRFEHVQRVLDACQASGVYRISLGASKQAP